MIPENEFYKRSGASPFALEDRVAALEDACTTLLNFCSDRLAREEADTYYGCEDCEECCDYDECCEYDDCEDCYYYDEYADQCIYDAAVGVNEDILDTPVMVMPEIRNIYYCAEPGREKVIVIFKDNTKIIKRPAGGDVFDLKVGVAMCMADKMFGSNSRFSKFVRKTAKCPEAK